MTAPVVEKTEVKAEVKPTQQNPNNTVQDVSFEEVASVTKTSGPIDDLPSANDL
jgi:hypothetical protein